MSSEYTKNDEKIVEMIENEDRDWMCPVFAQMQFFADFVPNSVNVFTRLPNDTEMLIEHTLVWEVLRSVWNIEYAFPKNPILIGFDCCEICRE